MAFIFKTVLRRENKQFVIHQGKANSRKSQVLVIDRKTNITDCYVAEIDNKTGLVEWANTEKFNPSTIDELKTALQIWF